MGVDEAGRGPWAGPVVAAAVRLRGSEPPVPVDDSKKLTAKRRQYAFDAITAECDWGVGIISALRIDRSNILQATFQAMADALEGLSQRPDLVLIDGNQLPKIPYKAQAVIGGDGICPSISCASIVAKVLRDDIMCFYDALFPHYGFAKHKGYGTAQHIAALKDYRPSLLHRKSYRPVANAC